MTMRRVIVLGLDAASPELIFRWARAGALPNIRSLLDRGLSGPIRGVDGYFIGSTWPSFYTGAHPATHGFHYQHQLVPGTYQLRDVAEGEPTRCAPVWRRLSAAGRRVALLDVPLSRLDPVLNGLQVVEWGVHDNLYGHATQPPELKADIAKRFGPHLVGGHCDGDSRTTDDYREFTELLLKSVTTKARLTRDLLAVEPWDLFIQVFSESHCVGHQCWHLHDVNHPAHNLSDAAATGDPVRRVYQALDKAVGEILTDATDATVIVMSAHGMTHWYGLQFLLRDILVRLGAAVPAAASPAKRPGAGDLIVNVAGTAWRRLPMSLRKSLVPLRRMLHRADAKGPRLATEGLEPSRSQCFPLSNGMGTSGIRLNVAGREPHGPLQPGAELESFVAALTADLLSLEDASTGARLVSRVLRTADAHSGPCLGLLPDLVVEWSRDFVIGSAVVGEGRGSEVTVRHPRVGTLCGVNRYGRTGEHAPEGWFIAAGPGVAAGTDCAVSVLDFAPTFCSLLGVSDDGFDGRPIDRIAP